VVEGEEVTEVIARLEVASMVKEEKELKSSLTYFG
jgi:hypothetical protein